VPKTGAYPPNEAARNRHNGALLAPRRRNPLEHRLEDRVAGQRPPGRFDQLSLLNLLVVFSNLFVVGSTCR